MIRETRPTGNPRLLRDEGIFPSTRQGENQRSMLTPNRRAIQPLRERLRSIPVKRMKAVKIPKTRKTFSKCLLMRKVRKRAHASAKGKIEPKIIGEMVWVYERSRSSGSVSGTEPDL